MPLTILTALMPLNKSADTLWQFRRYPLTIPRKSFDNSAEIFWRLRGNLLTTPQMICGLLARQIHRYCKVSCDMYCSNYSLNPLGLFRSKGHLHNRSEGIFLNVCEICCSQKFKAFFRTHVSSPWKGHGRSTSAFTGNPRNFWQDTAEFVGIAQLVKSTVLW